MREGIPEQMPAIIFVWAFDSSEHAPNSYFKIIIDSAIRNFPFVNLIIPTLFERRINLSPFRKLTHRVAWIEDRLRSFTIDSVFFAHDASEDQTAQVLMQAYPESNHICFGDPPGFLLPQFHTQYQSNLIKRRILQIRSRGLSSPLSPAQSIVTIDFNNNRSTETHNVLIIPRGLVIETLINIQRGIDQSKECIPIDYRGLEESKTSSMLLLSNFSESRLTTESNELALYADICKEFCSIKAKLIIKPHFGTKPAFLKKLMSCLSLYNPETLPSIVSKMPVEFLPDLVNNYNIISASSSSALISYVYDEEISHALTSSRIQHYFKPAHVPYMFEANQMIKNSLSHSRRKIEK